MRTRSVVVNCLASSALCASAMVAVRRSNFAGSATAGDSLFCAQDAHRNETKRAMQAERRMVPAIRDFCWRRLAQRGPYLQLAHGLNEHRNTWHERLTDGNACGHAEC